MARRSVGSAAPRHSQVHGHQVGDAEERTADPKGRTDATAAEAVEQAFARAGHVVVSNSRNHRMAADVPLVVPEINADHLKLIPHQQRQRGWDGQIVTNPNCSTVVLSLSLAPLKPFGIRRVLATTMQAISGAGYPGVSAMDIQGNVIPFIAAEEEKMEQETQKILGEFSSSGIRIVSI